MYLSMLEPMLEWQSVRGYLVLRFHRLIGFSKVEFIRVLALFRVLALVHGAIKPSMIIL